MSEYPFPSIKHIEVKPRYDLNPDWVMFRLEVPLPPDAGGDKHWWIMPTKFYMGDWLFETVEDYPHVDGWFMTKKTVYDKTAIDLSNNPKIKI